MKKKPETKPETKSLTVEVKAGPENVIEAYASVFAEIDSYGDIVQRGAFAKTITERGPQGSRKIKALYNHDHYSHLPVGVPQTMFEDGYGLLTATKMSKTQLGQDVYILADEGALSEMSIGFNAIKAEYPERDPNGVFRILTEVKLFEYSFVPFPANEAAMVTGVKSLSDLEHEIARWKTIAEVGLSEKAGRVLSGANAKRIVSALKDLQDLLADAGITDAADSTSDSSSDEKGSTPPEASPLLSVLQLEAKSLGAESRGAHLLGELRAFGASLRS